MFVHGPADGWKVLALGGLAPGLTTVVAFWLAFRNLPVFLPTWKLVRPAVVMGWPMFPFRSAESLYGVGNTFILGFACSPLRKWSAILHRRRRSPKRHAIFPRLSHLAATGGEKAAAPLVRMSAASMISGGAALGAGPCIFAPLGTRLLLGGAFTPAVTVLRILSLLPVLLAVTYTVGFQWLLPFGKDRVINQIIICAGLINVAPSRFCSRLLTVTSGWRGWWSPLRRSSRSRW